MAEHTNPVLETLRRRVLRGLQWGTLSPGDRLPGARGLAQEFGVDFRVILNAYRALSREGLVRLQARGGAYVDEQRASSRGVPVMPEGWIADLLTDALAREIPAPDFHEWLRRCMETLRLRAVVVASDDDQAQGLARELTEDFGFDATGLTVGVVRRAASPPLPVRRADLLVTTRPHGAWLRPFAQKLGKPVVVVDVRPDLSGGDWALLLRQPVYVIVATQDFGRMLREFLAAVPGVANLRVVVFGTDDLGAIPAGAPTYLTQRVRAAIDTAHVAGAIIPPARTIRSESARALFAFIVRANLAAIGRRFA